LAQDRTKLLEDQGRPRHLRAAEDTAFKLREQKRARLRFEVAKIGTEALGLNPVGGHS
jgi:hypothetical protein